MLGRGHATLRDPLVRLGRQSPKAKIALRAGGASNVLNDANFVLLLHVLVGTPRLVFVRSATLVFKKW